MENLVTWKTGSIKKHSLSSLTFHCSKMFIKQSNEIFFIFYLFPRLLDHTETLERSGRKLNQGQQLLAETENIGASILNDLSHQRETIQSTRDKVRKEKKMHVR